MSTSPKKKKTRDFSLLLKETIKCILTDGTYCNTKYLCQKKNLQELTRDIFILNLFIFPCVALSRNKMNVIVCVKGKKKMKIESVISSTLCFGKRIFFTKFTRKKFNNTFYGKKMLE
jgi:hypothetical protein